MTISQQNPDGSWGPAEPLGYQGWKAKLEQFFYKLRLKRLGTFMGRWDERALKEPERSDIYGTES